LSLKTLIDYLRSEGLNATSPFDALEYAFELNLIKDISPWQEALEQGISSNNTYDEQSIHEIEWLIRKYYLSIKGLLQTLQAKIPENTVQHK